MNKFVLAATAALIGAAGVLATPAEAAGAKPQVFKCKTGSKAYKDNTRAKSGIAMCNVAQSTFFNYAISSGAIKIQGLSSISSQWLMPCLSTKDIRTAGVLPLTFRPGGSDDTVTATFGTTKIATLTGAWGTDENDPNSFSVVFKKYDAATSRLQGTFGGTLAPGDDSPIQKPLKISKGSFNLLVSFLN